MLFISVNGMLLIISNVLFIWWNVRYNSMKIIINVIGIMSLSLWLVCFSSLNCLENVMLVFGFNCIFLVIVFCKLWIIDIMLWLWVLI